VYLILMDMHGDFSTLPANSPGATFKGDCYVVCCDINLVMNLPPNKVMLPYSYRRLSNCPRFAFQMSFRSAFINRSLQTVTVANTFCFVSRSSDWRSVK